MRRYGPICHRQNQVEGGGELGSEPNGSGWTDIAATSAKGHKQKENS
jgi:hypothetical protein